MKTVFVRSKVNKSDVITNILGRELFEKQIGKLFIINDRKGFDSKVL